MSIRFHLDISPKHLMLTLLLAQSMLLLISSLIYQDIIATSSHIRKLFDITLEGNIPTWFSSILLLMVAITSCAIVQQYWKKQHVFLSISWLMIALFFLYMSIDDASRLHERVATAMADYLENNHSRLFVIDQLLSFPSYYWQIMFLPFFAFMGSFIFYRVIKDFSQNRLRLLFCVGLAGYVVAVLMDFADGNRAYATVLENTTLSLKQAKHLSRSIEEYIEMVGTTCILVALLYHYNCIANSEA